MIQTPEENLRLRLRNLRIEYAKLEVELASVYALLPGSYYMDPPDGGDVTPLEQMKRLAEDAKRYRECSIKSA